MNRRIILIGHAAGTLLFGLLTSASIIAGEDAPKAAPVQTLITNARVFDGKNAKLADSMNVLIEGNKIAKISKTPLTPAANATVIDAKGRTLMPGLIDAHTHLMFATVPQMLVFTSDIGYLNVAAVKAANDMLMRGFTSIRDLGGPVFGLKKGIDAGLVPGPRIWPSGAFISQTGGHGDFRLPNELPAHPGDYSYTERVGATAIADNADAVRQRTREQLALGASQIKLMAGGGVASSFDPLDVTQYTVPELRAAVEAAENWGTYVTVHAYTPRAVRQAIEAGVKCIDHGQLLDEPTVKLMAEKACGGACNRSLMTSRRHLRKARLTASSSSQMFSGTDNAYTLAKKYRIKTAWGTDMLFSAENATKQGATLAKMVRWYSPAEVLKMATADNAELLALSGLRSPYAGKLGVVEEGALADLLLVEGNPIENITLIAEPDKNFALIMKDGKIYKNTIK